MSRLKKVIALVLAFSFSVPSAHAGLFDNLNVRGAIDSASKQVISNTLDETLGSVLGTASRDAKAERAMTAQMQSNALEARRLFEQSNVIPINDNRRSTREVYDPNDQRVAQRQIARFI